jgi:carboxyl-terminal processing protease
MDENRDSFKKKYPDFKTFTSKFEVTDEMIEKIMAAGDKEGVNKATAAKIDPVKSKGEKKPTVNDKAIVSKDDNEVVKRDEKSVAFARPLLKRQIKALIARDLFAVSDYFQIMNAEDETINKAVEVITQKGTYDKILSGK